VVITGGKQVADRAPKTNAASLEYLEFGGSVMKIYTGLIDKKIMGINVSAEMTIAEYLDFAEVIIENNDLQRTQVRSEGKPYELLRRDLAEGCVIPPIILAVSDGTDGNLRSLVQEVIATDSVSDNLSEIQREIQSAINERRVLILDGLQRTYTLLSVLSDLSDGSESSMKDKFLGRHIRFEIYLGLSKQGILYRMLTLNTGQTPMSFRHQLEILYHDYLDGKNLPVGIEVVREKDERRARGTNRYKFSDVVEMFYSFSTGSPLPYDKQALVGSLKEMSFLEDYKYEPESDAMADLLANYNKFARHVGALSMNWSFSPERTPTISRPFGNSVDAIFSRTQPMAAFGAECKRLIEKGIYENLSGVSNSIDKLKFESSPEASLDQLVLVLNEIGGRAKKIGDAQRYFFQLAFREMLLPDANGYLNLSSAWVNAQEKYEMLYT
jgi:hypothetical protein